ncbi:DUF5949 family protein [Streptomyces sp. CA-210063]|uniref:DUF5949 family protein n=1 Tax=Streptomyces sp. CA-210063 TaxID=2801029 RepID=UPI00214B356D|nr:DUF5949 family protein [Streptomyces sp. CA-210063]UUU33859.1 DUF5949 family protein [Streptomyces sp. CA-210063]
MTSIPTETLPLRRGDLGTVVVMAWSGEAPADAMPHLRGPIPGDGENRPEAPSATVTVTVEPEAPAAFTGDTETLTRAAHVLLPTRGLRA